MIRARTQYLLAPSLALCLLAMPSTLVNADEGELDQLARPIPATRATPPIARPATFRAGDGHEIPIQREWTLEEDSAKFEHLPIEQQPYRFDQKNPSRVYTEERAGHQPLYYFNDVRWRQQDRPEGAKLGRQAYFTTVRVDLEKVKAAWFCMKPFAPKFVAGHAAILLEFEKGGFVNLDGEESPGFVLSYEAYLRVTQKYGMIGGQFQKKFQIVYVVSTWQDFLVRSIRFNESVVKRWKLKLSDDQLRDLALGIGKTVLADHTADRYNTTRHSCVTAALDLIFSVVPESQRSDKKWLWGLIQNPGWALPVFADDVLKNHGLLATPKETITEVPSENGTAPVPAPTR